jgi:hypothetical protein
MPDGTVQSPTSNDSEPQQYRIFKRGDSIPGISCPTTVTATEVQVQGRGGGSVGIDGGEGGDKNIAIKGAANL